MPRDQVDLTEEAAELGRLRCLTDDQNGSPLFIEPPPEWTQNKSAFVCRQLTRVGEDELLIGYAELLRRAKSLVSFFTHNVGLTDDFPVTVVGDTPEAEQFLMQRVQNLSVIVDYLEEIS